jgi:hypothetical protein
MGLEPDLEGLAEERFAARVKRPEVEAGFERNLLAREFVWHSP